MKNLLIYLIITIFLAPVTAYATPKNRLLIKCDLHDSTVHTEVALTVNFRSISLISSRHENESNQEPSVPFTTDRSYIASEVMNGTYSPLIKLKDPSNRSFPHEYGRVEGVHWLQRMSKDEFLEGVPLSGIIFNSESAYEPYAMISLVKSAEENWSLNGQFGSVGKQLNGRCAIVKTENP